MDAHTKSRRAIRLEKMAEFYNWVGLIFGFGGILIPLPLMALDLSWVRMEPVVIGVGVCMFIFAIALEGRRAMLQELKRELKNGRN